MGLSDDEAIILDKLRRCIKSGHPDMDEFLDWCADRLVRLGENPNVDFVQALRRYARDVKEIKNALES